MTTATSAAAPVPRKFLEYVRSFGPGIVIVLTWLGAGDVVDMATAGANYGYSLLWVFVVAVAMRFFFVSSIARYQLCNQHGEGVLDGLVRLHPAYAPILFVAAIVMGHVYGAYMTRGIGEVSHNVFGFGAIWQWALGWNALALYLVFRPSFHALERVFLFFLAVLSFSFLGCAIWVGFDPRDVVTGLVRMEMPGTHGVYNPWRVALAMVGAVGGSLMNLVYPYFLDAKGWRGPQYRRVQLYDLTGKRCEALLLDAGSLRRLGKLHFPLLEPGSAVAACRLGNARQKAGGDDARRSNQLSIGKECHVPLLKVPAKPGR